MIILTIRTDKAEAELGLFEDSKQLAYEKWQAHRELSSTIHTKIKELLESQHKRWQDIQAVACYKGPGSFTGLRIGLTVSNAIAANLEVPIVGETGQDWLKQAVKRLEKGDNEKTTLPEYGAPVHVTKPKK